MSEDVSIRTPTYRVPRHRGMDPTTRRLAMTAIGLGSALVAVVGAWSLTAHHGGGVITNGNGVPVVEAPSGPMRIKPANPGGMQLSAAEQDLFGGQSGGSGQEGKLAPGPEVPDPAALRAPAAPPAVVTPAVTPAPQVQATSTPQVQTAPVPTVQTTPTQAPPPPAPAMAAKPAAPVPATVQPTGPVFVQLAALPTEQAAKDEWALLQRKLPELLKDRQPSMSTATVNGRTWWRVRTGGFANAGDAKGFCDQAHAKGASCDVARF